MAFRRLYCFDMSSPVIFYPFWSCPALPCLICESCFGKLKCKWIHFLASYNFFWISWLSGQIFLRVWVDFKAVCTYTWRHWKKWTPQAVRSTFCRHSICFLQISDQDWLVSIISFSILGVALSHACSLGMHGSCSEPCMLSHGWHGWHVGSSLIN